LGAPVALTKPAAPNPVVPRLLRKPLGNTLFIYKIGLQPLFNMG